jgi:hypothetical protein
MLGSIGMHPTKPGFFLTSAVPPVHRKALKDLRKNVAGLVRKWWSQSNLWQKWSEKGLIH